jgi:hypothetical protein
MPELRRPRSRRPSENFERQGTPVFPGGATSHFSPSAVSPGRIRDRAPLFGRKDRLQTKSPVGFSIPLLSSLLASPIFPLTALRLPTRPTASITGAYDRNFYL